MLERSTLVATLLGVAACSGNLIVGHQSTGGSPIGSAGASSGGPSPSAGQVASTGTSGASGNGPGNGSGVSSNGSGSGAGSGTGTGGATTGNVFGAIDGGYVFCDPSPDAGSSSGTRWMCPPGTYICDFAHPGHCFQCLSDADCTNPAVPTYDHNDHARSRCDLSSGISGYQNFCQVCLANADCKKGEVCDLNPAHREPPVIDDVGFETCGCLPDAGKSCPVPTCDPATCPLSQACTNDLECGNGKPYCIDGGCAPCRTNADCTHLEGSGACERNNYCGDSVKMCASDADCAGIVYASSCLSIGGGQECGCGSDIDCIGSPTGPRCDQRVTDTTYGNCGCQTPSDCAPGQTCPQATIPSAISACQDTCNNDTAKCQTGYYCDPSNVCRSHCDPGYSCAAREPVCDVDDLGSRNFNGVTWCYACLASADCDAGQACDSDLECGPCNAAAPCPDGQTCASDLACHTACSDSADCPAGQICDTLDLLGGGPLCYQCLTAGDCPGDQGCDAKTHTCGRCESPLSGGIYDCRPGDDCSNYWPDPQVKTYGRGVCLHRCDRSPCPADMPSCQLVPSISVDHKYCVGCTQDSDCKDAGPGTWCDITIHFTFQCQPADLRGPIYP